MTQTEIYIWHRPSWPEFRWDNAALLKLVGICRFQQGSLLTQMKDLGFDVRQQARAEVLIEEALKTSEIEGERLDTMLFVPQWPNGLVCRLPVWSRQKINRPMGSFKYCWMPRRTLSRR